MSDATDRKLTAARTRLILDKPFLGALVLRLPLQAADPKWCPTTATDARKFYFNPEYIDALSIDQTQFVLAHEALHCALSHFARREHRSKKRWDVACDYAVNPLLIGDGMEPPPGALHESSFAGMTAEEIYPSIDEADEEQPMDRHIYDEHTDADSGSGGNRHDARGKGGGPAPDDPDETRGGSAAGQPPPLDTTEAEALKVQWQQRLAGSAQQAMQAGKLDGLMARIVDHLLQPQLPWRMLLARYMTAAARDDYTWMRPSRREGQAILPSLRSAQIDVVVALDTSGSISGQQFREFVQEIDAIKGQMRARLTIYACDSRLAAGAPWVYEPWETIDLPDNFGGGGGTNFVPVFDAIETADSQPDLLVYLTDAKGRFPETESAFPVIWLVKGKQPVPWGQRVQLN